jgi:hypothetical protein
MFNNQVIAMHLAGAAPCHASTVDTHDTSKTPPNNPTTPTAESPEPHFGLQKYLTFLETQSELIQSFARFKQTPILEQQKMDSDRALERMARLSWSPLSCGVSSPGSNS